MTMGRMRNGFGPIEFCHPFDLRSLHADDVKATMHHGV
jgi:hypothetical protein